jgi:hypothetical protein
MTILIALKTQNKIVLACDTLFVGGQQGISYGKKIFDINDDITIMCTGYQIYFQQFAEQCKCENTTNISELQQQFTKFIDTYKVANFGIIARCGNELYHSNSDDRVFTIVNDNFICKSSNDRAVQIIYDYEKEQITLNPCGLKYHPDNLKLFATNIINKWKQYDVNVGGEVDVREYTVCT